MAVHRTVEAFRLFTEVTPDAERMLQHFTEPATTMEEDPDARVG
jgi:shikimate dehydrogenase